MIYLITLVYLSKHKSIINICLIVLYVVHRIFHESWSHGKLSVTIALVANFRLLYLYLLLLCIERNCIVAGPQTLQDVSLKI